METARNAKMCTLLKKNVKKFDSMKFGKKSVEAKQHVMKFLYNRCDKITKH